MRPEDSPVLVTAAGASRLEERVVCEIAQACGGCALIGHEPALQLEYKRAVVRKALGGWRELAAVPVDPCVPAPRRAGYRNRARLVVANGRGNRVRAGLARPGGGEPVPIGPCRIHGDPTMAFLPRITDWLGRWRLVRPSGPIKLIDVREAADERCHLTLLLECEPDRAPALPVDDLAGRLPELCGVSVSFNPLPGSFALGRSVRTVWGNGTFLAGVPAASAETRLFEVPAAGFFQVAPSQLPALHSIMAEHLGSAGTLFDLYCGVGVHGLSLAEAGPEATLIGIEESPAAAACARRNAHRLGIEARIVARKVEDVLARLVEETPPARVVLNPGPAGCQECVLDALAPVPDRRMVYHACDSVSLARDLAALVGRGWGVVRVVPVDMLPQTTKVEALALLDPVPHRC